MTTTPPELDVEVAVVGAGQAGLAVGYHLQRAGLLPGRDVVLVDAGERPGGAWPRTWEGLRLFSPAAYSSLPGWMMPTTGSEGFPPSEHVVAYLTAYEQRYGLAPLRPHRVREVVAADADPAGPLLVRAPGLEVRARVVVSATGTWDRPFVPHYPGSEEYAGRQLHVVDHRSPEQHAGQHVLVVGGGNSAAQVLAQLSGEAGSGTRTTWVTPRPPRFLPDEVDGRALFDAATARVRAREAGAEPVGGPGDLGDVVVVPEVRAARDRGAMVARPMFTRLTRDGVAWADGSTLAVDVVLWCTGFRPALTHLAPLRLRDADGRVPLGGTSGTRAERDHRVHLVGYGDWTGPASATLIGVGRTARATVAEVVEQIAATG